MTAAGDDLGERRPPEREDEAVDLGLGIADVDGAGAVQRDHDGEIHRLARPDGGEGGRQGEDGEEDGQPVSRDHRYRASVLARGAFYRFGGRYRARTTRERIFPRLAVLGPRHSVRRLLPSWPSRSAIPARCG